MSQRYSLAFIIILTLLTINGSAHAAAGAQYSCSTKSGIFTLLPYDDDINDVFANTLEPGFKALPTGTSNIKCKIGKRNLQAQITLISPQSHGECMGDGAVNIISLGVNNVELAKHPFLFDWCSGGERESVVKLQIKSTDSIVSLEKCSTKEYFGDDHKQKIDCSSESFNVDKIADENAAIDHQLADIKTQNEQSVKALAPENDLAQFFASANQDDSEIPLCAHWYSLFLNATTDPKRQRHGRIAGNEDERVYVTTANPQLCKNNDDDGCTAKSYLIPGDRVDIGFICGDWTQVQYERHLNSQPAICGWVKTASLYAVDPVVLPPQSTPEPTTKPKGADDALLQAISAKDEAEVKRLIAIGTSPDGQSKEGYPLDAAIKTDDPEMVRLLLQMGANVNAKSSTGYDKCHILNLGINNQEIFDILFKAGINLNCQGGAQNPSPLMEAAGYNRLQAWEFKYDRNVNTNTNIKDPIQLVKRLLVAGADPNLKDYEGKTALFYAIEANNIDVAKLLLESGADPNISIDRYNPEYPTSGNQSGSTPLMAALNHYPLSYDPTMFELLLATGANPDYRNKSAYDDDWDSTTSGAVTFAGQTVLTRAAEDGYITLVRLLLEHGADTKIPRQDGKNAMEIAKFYSHPEIAALIAAYIKEHSVKTMPTAALKK